MTYLIGISGGSCSGKSTFSELLARKIGFTDACVLSMDRFYKNPVGSELHSINFDRIEAYDTDLLFHCLQEFKKGKRSDIPFYDFITSTRTHYEEFVPKKYIIVEGILLFNIKALNNMFDLKIFLDLEPDVRLARRVLRDVTDRGRELRSVVEQYFLSVKKMHNDYIEPNKLTSDIVLDMQDECTSLDNAHKLVLTLNERRNPTICDT